MDSACGADEVGFGCCEPQRLGAARETTASRRHAWLGIALGVTLNIPEKQNGFPNKFLSRRARQTQMAEVPPSTPLGKGREFGPSTHGRGGCAGRCCPGPNSWNRCVHRNAAKHYFFHSWRVGK